MFIDDRFIGESNGITLKVNPPVKKEIVLELEKPWENILGQYTTVVEDEGIYKMWYDAFVGIARSKEVPLSVAYATSTDGVHWERPDLGLFDWYGHQQNNLVMPGTSGGVMIDPLAPSEHRYKAVIEGFANSIWPESAALHWDMTGGGVYLATSPDGLRWKVVTEPASPFFHDSQNHLLYDDRIRKYVAYFRTHEQGRTLGRVELDDPMHVPWPYRKRAGIQPNQYGLYLGLNHGEYDTVMACDERDAPDSDVQIAPVVKYPWADDVYLSLVAIYRHYTEVDVSQPHGGKRKDGKFSNDGTQDVQLGVSRDGIAWQRPDRSPYIPLGLMGDWDGGCIWPTLGIIRRGNEIWQYYAGTWHTHGAHGSDTKSGGLCRLVQRLDGFVSADAGEKGGEIVTPLLTFKGTQLVLNVDCTAQGTVQVEVRDEKDQPIPGYTLVESEPVDRNQIAAPVRWTSDKEIGALQGQPVRLCFKMRTCKLYAFQFTSP